MPSGGGEGEEAGADARGDAGFGATDVAFEAESACEGLVDRFDDLAQGPQERRTALWSLVLGGGARQGDADVVEVGFERFGAVAVVGDEGLARPADPGRSDNVGADFAFVGFRAGDRTRSAAPPGWPQGVAADPRSTADATRSSRIGPIGRGRSALGSHGWCRTRPGWSPQATRRHATTRTRVRGTPMTRAIISPLRRSRLLQPSRFARYGNHGRRCAFA